MDEVIFMTIHYFIRLLPFCFIFIAPYAIRSFLMSIGWEPKKKDKNKKKNKSIGG